MNVEIKEQMYEGKAKQVLATSDPKSLWFITRTTPPPATEQRKAPSAARAW